MSNTFNRADSGFGDQGRVANFAVQFGRDLTPTRVQESIGSYRGLLSKATLKAFLVGIWKEETSETLQIKRSNDEWVFSIPRKLTKDERSELVRIREEKMNAEGRRRRSISPE
ncbi:hypothetical protein NPX13_g2027 [Xylaria arbuscula]|uniref:Uncharacterized protein n=1 Tax=Xylaria arbuscula TaxID=114810 RepID=A0A9W8NKD6_9PEZI|nr:hypothetical protein NPX13_g2027 [Xylaria arbuscula]